MNGFRFKAFLWIAAFHLGLGGTSAALIAQGLSISSFSPPEISYLGKTPFVIKGKGFTESTEVIIDTVRLKPTFVDPSTLKGVAPAHAATPSPVEILVSDPLGGRAVLPGALRYIGPLALAAILPDTLAAGQGGAVTITGTGFTPETALEIGGSPLENVQFIDARTVKGTAPALPGGAYDVKATEWLTAGPPPASTLPGALTYTAPGRPPVIGSIQPRHLPAAGGATVDIQGSDFTRTVKIFFADGRSTLQVPFTFVNSSLLRGTVPAHAPGTVDAIALSDQGETRLGSAAEYEDPAAPGLEQIEGTLVDGIAEIEWVNPVAYQKIHVYRDGKFHTTLPGSAVFFRDPSPIAARKAARYCFIGEIADGISAMTDFTVAVQECQDYFLIPSINRGDTDFPLLGGHQPYQPQGGGGWQDFDAGGGGEVHEGINAPYQFPPIVFSPISGGPLLNPSSPLEAGYMPNEVLTGFSLFQEARKIKIEVHGAKILNGPDLSLRVLIQSVTPGVDRSIELEMPPVLIHPRHAWIELTYNTENPPPAPGEPPQAPGDPPLPPHPPLPAADYQVRLYAVGGLFGKTHFTISSDASQDQILVPGVGCPSYPLIRVTDTTEKNSNPIIHGITQFEDTQSFLPLKDEYGNYINTVVAKVKAQVSDPDLPEDPILRYRWRVHTGVKGEKFPQGIDTKVTASDTATLLFPDYGYYLVELTVEDARCGRASREFVVKVHPVCIDPPPGSGPSFTFPSPKPQRTHFISNLPGGMDAFEGSVPAMYRAFVVDEGGGCNGSSVTQSVQFGLFPLLNIGGQDPSPITLTNGQPAVVQGLLLNVDAGGQEELLSGTDVLLTNDNSGARFWAGIFPDMGLVADSPLGKVVLKARGSPTVNRTNLGNSGWGPWKPVTAYDVNQNPIGASAMINIYKKPAFLDAQGAYATGFYDTSRRTYHFNVDIAPPGASGISFPNTQAVPVFAGSVFPALSNQVASVGLNTALSFYDGQWTHDSLRASLDATAYNGRVNKSRELLSNSGGGQSFGEGGGGSAPGFDPETLTYDYCNREVLFQDGFNTTLFDSIIYAGAIGPVQVTVTASMSLGVGLGLETQTEIHLRGLPQGGESPFEAHFWLLPQADVSLSASVEADIFLGVFSIEGGATFATAFRMPFHVGATSSAGLIGPEAGLEVSMDLTLWFEACIDVILTEICAGIDYPIFEDKVLYKSSGFPGAPASCPSGGGGAQLTGGGGAAPPIQLNTPQHQLCIASSPDGQLQFAAGRFAFAGYDQLGYLVRKQGGFPGQTSEWTWPPIQVQLPPAPGENYAGVQSDPQVVFLDGGTVLLAWTQNFSKEDPELAGIPSGENVDTELFNRITRRSEIVYSIGAKVVDPSGKIYFDWGPLVRLSGDPGPDGYRADGRVSLAKVPDEDSVWAAWVRFETEDMVSDLPQPIPQAPPLPPITTKVNMRQTGIAARKILGGAPVGPVISVSGANNAIDIEPDIAAASDGLVYVVWVNDSIHEDLIESNQGRNILFSRLAGASWTAPAPALAGVSNLPGILRPSLALAESGHGMMVFSALPENAAPSDTGLGNTRLLYSLRLSGAAANPVWGEPVLIFRDCNEPIFAHWGDVFPQPPVLEENNPLPDFTIITHAIGPMGTRHGAGDALAVTYSAKTNRWNLPIHLTPDDRIHQDIAATMTPGGELVMIHQSPGPASLKRAASGSGAIRGELFGDILAQHQALAADPAIVSCRISDPHAGPGVQVEATIVVANGGFARTPVDRTGAGVLMLRLSVQDGDAERVIGEALLPVLEPGEEATLRFDLTMPRQPGRMLARVDEVRGEFNPGDNLRDCPLGTQAPAQLACRLLEAGEHRAVELRWTNSSLYDSVFIYRDGRLAAELDGESTAFVDTGAGLLHQDGLFGHHDYSVRGRAGNSFSVKTQCSIDLPQQTQRLFRRGECNDDGAIDISDAVCMLHWLFLGGAEPGCVAAANVNGDEAVDISDPVSLLDFLFLGGPDPVQPFPDCGPVLLEADRGLGCETPMKSCR